MNGFVQNIEDLAAQNSDFRRVLYTAKHCQLVVMALKPKEDIGAKVHRLDQFFRVEEGTGEAVLNGVRTPIRAGFAVIVPAGRDKSHIRYLPMGGTNWHIQNNYNGRRTRLAAGCCVLPLFNQVHDISDMPEPGFQPCRSRRQLA